MALSGWRETTVELLPEKIGPVAALLVDETLRKSGIAGQQMPASQFLRFLQALNHELPGDIDRNAM